MRAVHGEGGLADARWARTPGEAMGKLGQPQRGGAQGSGGSSAPASDDTKTSRVQNLYEAMVTRFGADRVDHNEASKCFNSLNKTELDGLFKHIAGKTVQGKADSLKDYCNNRGFSCVYNKDGSSSSKGSASAPKPKNSNGGPKRINGKSPSVVTQREYHMCTVAAITNAMTNCEISMIKYTPDSILDNCDAFTFMNFMQLNDFVKRPFRSNKALGIFIKDTDGAFDGPDFSQYAPSKVTLPMKADNGSISHVKFTLLQFGSQHARVRDLDQCFSIAVTEMSELVFVVRKSVVPSDMWDTFTSNSKNAFEAFIKGHIPSQSIIDGNIRCKTMLADGRDADIPKGEPFEVRAYFRCLEKHVHALYAHSGVENVIVLKANSVDAKTKIIPLDFDLSVKDTINKCKTMISNKYLGVVPFRNSWAVRIRAEDYMDARIILCPNALRSSIVPMGNVDSAHKYVLSGIDKNLTTQQVVEFLSTWHSGWHVSPLFPPRYGQQYMSLIVGASKPPPAMKIPLNHVIVAISPYFDKKQLEANKRAAVSRTKLQSAIQEGEKQRSYAQVLQNLSNVGCPQQFDLSQDMECEHEVIPVPNVGKQPEQPVQLPVQPVHAQATVDAPATQQTPQFQPAPAVEQQSDVQVKLQESNDQITSLAKQLEDFKMQLQEQNTRHQVQLQELQTCMRKEFSEAIGVALESVKQQNDAMRVTMTEHADSNKNEIMDMIRRMSKKQSRCDDDQSDQPPHKSLALPSARLPKDDDDMPTH